MSRLYVSQPVLSLLHRRLVSLSDYYDRPANRHFRLFFRAVFNGETLALRVRRHRHCQPWHDSVLVLVVGIVPGLAMAIMGFKIPNPSLEAFRHPLMESEMFYRLRYRDDVRMWEYVNENCRDTTLLTHENRHLVYDPSIKLVHLDDWEVQKTYNMESRLDKLRLLKNLGVDYYLKIPMEDKHPINLRMGIQEWVGTPWLEEVYRSGENRLYKIHYPSELGANRDSNGDK